MAQVQGLGVHLKVKDIAVSRRWYESLGFVPVFGYGDDEFRATLPEGCPSVSERFRSVTYGIGASAKIEIADGHVAVKDSVFAEKITSPKVSAMIEVDSLVSIIKQLGDQITFPVRTYYWGTIEAVVRDPDGFVLVFIAKRTDEEVAAVKELVEVEDVKPQS